MDLFSSGMEIHGGSILMRASKTCGLDVINFKSIVVSVEICIPTKFLLLYGH
jgi:hypothetical protein